MKKCYGYAHNSGFSINNGIYPDSKKRYCIGLLGRIYNSGEIRESLNKSGLKVEKNTDIELVYKSFLKWGKNFIDHLRGSFLIVIYDSQKNYLLITRDPFGKYPLYYSNYNGGLYFSSDIGLLFSEYSLPKEIDPQSINYYFALRYIPQDSTIFKGVKKQSVATQLKFNSVNDELSVNSYWSFPVTDPAYGDEVELTDQLEEILKNSIRMRYSDSLPTGVFLSGGIDSSLLVGMMNELFSGTIKTFSIGFVDDKFDESEYSRIVSDYFATEHHELIVDSSFLEHFGKLGEFFNEPIGDPSAIPTYYLCKLASEYSTNVYCGEGADCLFLGMNTHEYTYNYSRVYEKAAPLMTLLAKLGKIIPDEVKWKILFQGLSPEEFFLKRSILFEEEERKMILSSRIKDYLGDNINLPEKTSLKVLDNYKGSIKGKMTYHNSTTEVDNTIAMRILLANAFSLYYSTPFMDLDLVKFVSGCVHPDMRIKRGVRKYLLKNVAKRYLPPTLPLNRKKGFNPPIDDWLRNDWWKFTREKILDIEDDLINRDYAETLLNKHKKENKDQGKKIFCLLMLRLWQESKNMSD